MCILQRNSSQIRCAICPQSQVANAIEWRALPADFPPHEAVYAFFKRWWSGRDLPQRLTPVVAPAAPLARRRTVARGTAGLSGVTFAPVAADTGRAPAPIVAD